MSGVVPNQSPASQSRDESSTWLPETLPGADVYVPLTSYNRRAFLIDSLECLQAQTYRDVHVVVVDDASPDGAGDVARDHATRPPEPAVGVVATEAICIDAGGRHTGTCLSDEGGLPDTRAIARRKSARLTGDLLRGCMTLATERSVERARARAGDPG